MEQFVDIAKTIGLSPESLGIGLVLALLLRYARGSFVRSGSGWMYVVAIGAGALGAYLRAVEEQTLRNLVSNALTMTAFVLIMQRVLQQAAKTVPWLPQDNEWVGKPTDNGGKP